jgi:hypothetical protein
MNKILKLQQRSVTASAATRGSNWSWGACGNNSTISINFCGF